MDCTNKKGVSFMARKMEIIFDFLRSDFEETVSLKTLMAFPIKLIESGRVEEGARLALVYKGNFDRICQEAGLETGTPSIGRADFIKGSLSHVKTNWYAQEFMTTIVDIYFRSLDVDGDEGISVEEWTHFYQMRGITDDKFCRSTFSKMDKNGDGKISKAEFEYAFRQFGLGEDPDVDFSFLYAKNL